MVNPYVLIATHERLSITKRNIECLLACNVGVILVVSDSGERHLFRSLFKNISVLQCENAPLGKKWQAGVMKASELGADPLIINGSDDILCPEFFDHTSQLLSEGYDFIGLKSWYVYDLKNIFHFEYQASMPLGGGRVYSKRLLHKINYDLFDTSRNRLLDDRGWHSVHKNGLKKIILNKPLILSVKGEWTSMNPVSKMFNHPNAKLIESIFDPKPILKKFNYG
jgi:hypothetical protein